MSSQNHSLSDIIRGTVEIMLGRATGLQRIDLSVDGFWISLYGLVLVGFLDASVHSMIYTSNQAMGVVVAQSRPTFVVVSILIQFASYGISMVALFFMVQRLGAASRFLATFTIHNWAAPVITAMVLPLQIFLIHTREIAHPDMPGTFWLLLNISMISLVIIVGIRIIRLGLQTTIGKAIGLFVVSTAVSLLMTSWLTGVFLSA